MVKPSQKRLFPRPRLLPLTIFAAGLMLTLRVGDIVQGVSGLDHAVVTVSGAEAQEQPTAAPDPAMPDETARAMGEEPLAPDAAVTDAASEAAQEIRRRRPSLADDPTLFTQSEIDLLQRLAERREQLENQERELDQREAMLKAAETKIDAKVRQLENLKSTIEGLIQKYDEQQDQKLLSLVKIYENMKPKDAANIFEELDLDTLLLVADRMKERRLAPIMAKMTPTKAREVTEELYRLRQLPKQGEGLGG